MSEEPFDCPGRAVVCVGVIVALCWIVAIVYGVLQWLRLYG